MKALRLLLSLMMLTLMTACATCPTKPRAQAIASEEQETKSPFFDWLTDQVINNLISWAL